MRLEEFVESISGEASHLSDEAVWEALSYEDQRSIARYFKDTFDNLEESGGYNQGFDDGKAEGREDTRVFLTEREEEDIRVQVLSDIKEKLRPVYNIVKPIIESLEY